ncbi:unannotated protein [freshwater metagenome]|uniref:Unannotated protein n=1 Tax=freshwater metagenome TaxID=449393 RepID=A0A6J7JXJ5_9ZZZZ
MQTWISIPDTWSIANEAPGYVTLPVGRVYVSSMARVRDYIAANLISTDVISDLQIVRLIAQSGHSAENDVAVYQSTRANYTITVNANGTITVADPRNGGGATIDGTDTLRNIETLRFTDGDVLVSSLAPAAPRLVAGGAVGGAGTIAVTWSATGVGSGVTIANYTARVWTTVNRTGTPVGTCSTGNGTTLTCTISAATGALAGSGLAAANYYVDVIATSSASVLSAASAVIGPIAVTQLVTPAISLSTQNLNGTKDSAITATSVSSAVGFSGSVTYAVTSGTLPAGLDFNTSTGAISGTPTVAATTTSVTITATGSISGSASATISITIADPAAASISPSTQTLNATQGVAITQTSAFTPSNFTPTRYEISSGSLAGLTFDTTSGRIRGTPTATLSATTFTITATDGSNSATATIAITVNAAVAPGSAPRSAPTGGSVTSGAAGTGTAVVSWSAVAGATRYTAQAFSSTNSTKVLRQCSVSGTGGATTFTCTISNLQRYVTYYVDVVARNNAGGLSSASRLPVTIL